MPRPDAGLPDCSTGLAKRVYDQLIGDTARAGFIGMTPPADWHDIVKAHCYAAAKGVADELQHSARATVDVTAGAPGSVAIVGTASNLSGVSIVTLTAPINPYRVVRLAFAAAMPDTNYAVSYMTEYVAGHAISATIRALEVITKAQSYVEIGATSTVPDYRQIDEYARRFSVFVDR